MDDAASDFGSYTALLRRRRVWILTIVPAVLLICVYLAFTLPAKYRSTATIILEQGSIPDELIKSTVNTPPQQQIEIIQGRALTVEALTRLVAEIDPYPEEPTWSAERKAQEISADTSLERVDPVTLLPLEDSAAFSLHYQNANPQRASLIATRLAELFLTYHQRGRVEAAKAGARMLEDRVAGLTAELRQTDEEYARLRTQHGGALPENSGRYEDARYRASRDLDDIEKSIRTAREQESQLAIQLGATSPNVMSVKGSDGDLNDIATVRSLLADAELRYTPDHPDVKRLRRVLAGLIAQGGAQKDGAGSSGAQNPEYRRIASQLNAARAEVAALQGAAARARQQLDQYTASSNPSAALTRQVEELDRRRTSLFNQFQEAEGKLKSAQLGQIVEADEHAERFALIRAPYPASNPYSPNRIGMILLGLVLGGALAAGAVALAESSDATVRGARDVVGFKDVPVLGSVSEMYLPEDLRRRKLIWGSVSAVYLLAFIFVVVTVVQTVSRDRQVQTTSAT